jgi:hypothetical protein
MLFPIRLAYMGFLFWGFRGRAGSTCAGPNSPATPGVDQQATCAATRTAACAAAGAVACEA